MEVEVPKSLQDKRKEEKEILSSSMLSNLIAVPTVQATTQEKQTKSPQKIQQQFTSKEYSIPLLFSSTKSLFFGMVDNLISGSDFLIPKLFSNTVYASLSKSLEAKVQGSSKSSKESSLSKSLKAHKEKERGPDQLLVQLRIISQRELLKDELIASLFTTYYFYDFLPAQQERGGITQRTAHAEKQHWRY